MVSEQAATLENSMRARQFSNLLTERANLDNKPLNCHRFVTCKPRLVYIATRCFPPAATCRSSNKSVIYITCLAGVIRPAGLVIPPLGKLVQLYTVGGLDY